MDAAFEADYHRAERGHWWCRARREFILRALGSVPRAARLVEIGCAGGALLDDLARAGFTAVEGIDASARAVEACRGRGLAQVRLATAAATGLPAASVDWIIASDVLEHCADEAAALREWRRVLRPGGGLWVGVPAYAFLWGPHDEINNHCRRYTYPRLRAALCAAGFTAVRGGYWNGTLWPAAVLAAAARRLRGAARRRGVPAADRTFGESPGLNRLLLAALRLENRCRRWAPRLPGVSAYAVARAPDVEEGV
jgi:SAM-dependent methyltransferase